MKALVIVLNAVDYLDEILSKFVEIGIEGATILDSQGMGSAIVYNDFNYIPIFSSLSNMIGDSHPYSKTIFTVIKSDDTLKEAVNTVQETLKGCMVHGAGFMFTVPIGEVFQVNPNE